MSWTQARIEGATRWAAGFMWSRFGQRMINAKSPEDFVMSLLASGHDGINYRRALACDIIDAYRSERGRTSRGKSIGREFRPLHSGMRARAEVDQDIADAVQSMGLSPEHQRIVGWMLAGDEQKWMAMRLGVSEARVSQIVRQIKDHLIEHSLWGGLVARHSRPKRKQIESDP